MIALEEWKKGLQAWQNIKKQSEVDGEQADLIIPVIEQKIKERIYNELMEMEFNMILLKIRVLAIMFVQILILRLDNLIH
jgi:hypothetical protein